MIFFARIFLGAALAVTFAGPAQAQQRAAPASQGPANALQGFSQNKDQPVQIEAATLEVREKDKVATFSGNVIVIQGDTTLRSQKLVVFYEDNSTGKPGGSKPAAITAAQPGPGGSSQIKRLEATGGVLVTQKDQTATGRTGVFDMRTNTITLEGDVVISQGKSVLQGPKLVVDRQTGVSRIESVSDSGRVRGIFQRGPEGSSPLKPPGTN